MRSARQGGNVTAMKSDGKRVLFSIVPASGHRNPIVPLARAMRERGHEVRIGSAARCRRRTEVAGLIETVTS